MHQGTKVYHILLTLLIVSFVQGHEWHSADGKRSFEAQFTGLQGDQIILTSGDGKSSKYALNAFSEEDKSFAHQAQKIVEESAQLGPSSYEIQHVLEDGWLCRMGRAGEPQDGMKLFLGDMFFCLTPTPDKGKSEAQFQQQQLFPAGLRIYHPKESDAVTIKVYATSLDVAVTERLKISNAPDAPPSDVYEPIIEISTIQSLGFCVGKQGLLVVNAALVKNISSLKIHANKDEFPATVVKVSEKYGLALLSCATELDPGHFSARKPLELGQSIFVISMAPKSTKKSLSDPTLSKGIISKIKKGELLRFDHDATTPTDSLGGCILGEKGDVLGLFFANPVDPDSKEKEAKPTTAGCFSTETLSAFLQSIPNMSPLRSPPSSSELAKNIEPLQNNMVLVTAQKKVNKTPKRIAGAGGGFSISSAGVRHNGQCRYFRPDKPCGANDGKPCKTCGG